jgi:hypothetical protein
MFVSSLWVLRFTIDHTDAIQSSHHEKDIRSNRRPSERPVTMAQKMKTAATGSEWM